MSNWFFSANPVFLQPGLFITRVITGMLMIYHGWETFDANQMSTYAGWFEEKSYAGPALWAYAGKIAELLAGIGLVLGLFTRLSCVAAIAAFGGIIFLLGDKGKIFQSDQHPFLFVILAFIFFFTGAGKWSADHFLFNKRK